MSQPVGRADHADDRATHQATRHGAAGRPHQPDAHTREPPATEHLWTLFQVDQQRINALDTIAMTIRGWMVTLVAAIVGFSLSQHHRSLLLVAMVGAALLGLLDIQYRATQLRHVDRVGKVQQVIAPDYRLRPRRYPGGPPWLKPVIQSRYHSSILPYLFVVFVLLLLWIAT